MQVEFELSGEEVLHLQGRIVLELPGYMTRLSPEQAAAVGRSPQRATMIVACGRSGGEIVLVTGDGRLMKVDITEHGLPDEDCMPIDHGHTVLFPQAVTRNNTSYEASARVLVGLATEMNVRLGTEPTYRDEGTTGDAEGNDP